MEAIQKNPVKISNSLTVPELENLMFYLSDKYYNYIPEIDDTTFDTLFEILKKRKPDSIFFKTTGAPIRNEIVKAELPVFLYGMEKPKSGSRELTLYFERFTGPYVISEKLDGVAGLLQYKDGVRKLFTKGKGSVGQDISYLIDSLSLPVCGGDFCVRGELIMKKKLFQEKYSKRFPKTRTVVAGLINSLKPDKEILRDISFVAFEIISDSEEKKSAQLAFLKKNKFDVVKYIETKDITESKLPDMFKEIKSNSEYDLDGIIITDDNIHELSTTVNVKHSIAFKINTLGIQTYVLDVIWSPSKYGALIPRIKIETVVIDGDNINYATGHNAKFIYDNNIGKDTIIRVVKSGDVIPYVAEIIKSTTALMPEEKYTWNESAVDIILHNFENNHIVIMKKIVFFFATLTVPYVKEGIVKKFMEADFDTLDKICSASEEDILTLEGVKEKSAQKIYSAIHDIIEKPIELGKLMVASSTLDQGFGEKKLAPLLRAFPDMITLKDETYTLNIPNPEEVEEVEGFSSLSTKKFNDTVTRFVKFLDLHRFLKINKLDIKRAGSQKLDKQNYVFSGFRDKKLEEYIITNGGNVENSVTKKTTFLVVKDENSKGNKVDKATKLNIPIILKSDVA